MPSIMEKIKSSYRVGEYPIEYNAKLHGPYDPARYYGKADTPLANVKLGEFGKWFSRRSFHPMSMLTCADRARWRYQHKYMNSKNAGMAMFIHVVIGVGALHYIWQYKAHTNERTVKYSW